MSAHRQLIKSESQHLPASIKRITHLLERFSKKLNTAMVFSIYSDCSGAFIDFKTKRIVLEFHSREELDTIVNNCYTSQKFFSTILNNYTKADP